MNMSVAHRTTCAVATFTVDVAVDVSVDAAVDVAVSYSAHQAEARSFANNTVSQALGAFARGKAEAVSRCQT